MAHKTRGSKTNYASDVSDEEWAFCAPNLVLMREDAPQRDYSMRAMFNAVRYMVRAGCPWRMIPNDLPPWPAVHAQAQRWIQAGCFEAMGHDLRKMMRLLAQKAIEPTTVIASLHSPFGQRLRPLAVCPQFLGAGSGGPSPLRSDSLRPTLARPRTRCGITPAVVAAA